MWRTHPPFLPGGRKRQFRGPPRHLTEAEINFLNFLFECCHGGRKFIAGLSDIFVQDMDDGGMGGVYFVSKIDGYRALGRKIVEAEFMDEDGIIVSVEINMDKDGNLYEFDSFKGNFSPLLNFPKGHDVKIKFCM